LPISGRRLKPIIGDRAYARTSTRWRRLARSIAEGLLGGGVLTVLNAHPGHGVADPPASSHGEWPQSLRPTVQTRDADFESAPSGRWPICRFGDDRTCCFTAIDALAPATTSANLIRK